MSTEVYSASTDRWSAAVTSAEVERRPSTMSSAAHRWSAAAMTTSAAEVHRWSAAVAATTPASTAVAATTSTARLGERER